MKPGHAGKIDFNLIFEAAFGSYTVEDGWLTGSYGSMPSIRAKQEGKKAVIVDTITDKSFVTKMAAGDPEATAIAQDTHRAWNDFLEGITGYDSKTRSKKIQKAAKKDA